MTIRKLVLSKSNILSATAMSKRWVESYKKKALALIEDKDKAKRIEACLCLSCYYLSNHIGGAAMTRRECACCDKEMLFSSTYTDALCKACARDNFLCKHCTADIDLKIRKKPRPYEGVDSVLRSPKE